MAAQAARVEPVIDPVEEPEVDSDNQARPAASLSAELIVRPDEAGETTFDPLFPPEEAELGGSGPRDPQDPIQAIRRSLKEPGIGRDQPTIEYKPAPTKRKFFNDTATTEIYTTCYFLFLMAAMYVLDVFPGSISELLGFGT
jgi:hypothetical protein